MRPATIQKLEKAGIPLVGYDEKTFDYCVNNDMQSMIVEGTRFLVGHGRKKIAFLQPSGVRDWYLLEPFKEVLKELDVPFHPDWVCSAVDMFVLGSGWDNFNRLWDHGEEKPDGLVIGIDTIFSEAVDRKSVV